MIDRGAVAGKQQRGGIELLDHRRPRDRVARAAAWRGRRPACPDAASAA